MVRFDFDLKAHSRSVIENRDQRWLSLRIYDSVFLALETVFDGI